jgi:hypothetical protein
MFLPAVLGGEVALPVGDIVEPFVDADDIADVPTAAFADYTRTAAAAHAWAGMPIGAGR